MQQAAWIVYYLQDVMLITGMSMQDRRDSAVCCSNADCAMLHAQFHSMLRAMLHAMLHAVLHAMC